MFGRGEGYDTIRWRGEVLGFSERISWKGEGLVRLEGDVLTFESNRNVASKAASEGTGDNFSCVLGEIRGVQISAKALQVTLEGSHLLQLRFIDDSPKRWEDLVRLALRRLYARSRLCITEFKPRIVTVQDPSDRGKSGCDG
jgi:hypothetical protein